MNPSGFFHYMGVWDDRFEESKPQFHPSRYGLEDIAVPSPFSLIFRVNKIFSLDVAQINIFRKIKGYE